MKSCGTISNHETLVIGDPIGEERENKTEEIFEKIMAIHFPKTVNYIKTEIQEVKITQNRTQKAQYTRHTQTAENTRRKLQRQPEGGKKSPS